MSVKYTMVRYTHQGSKFEILVDPAKGLAYKNGERADLANVLMIDTIFTDANKGTKPSESKLKAVFGTEDPIAIAELIFEKGVFQLTSQQRKNMTDQTLRQIITLISKNYVNPATKLPHPPLRVENALGEIKLSIDPFKDAEEQLKEIVNALRPILPMSMESVEIAIKIPAEYSSKSYGIVKELADITRDEWTDDGSWVAVVAISAAMQGELLDRLGKATQGNLQTNLMK
ncbi:ribosome assembly factor SBDS [Candidatus Bathyarchaeota archaeon]|jgi:ribosome maturation protein SDO1|nr:ribosome assembly factor SBDS [Candidatus Bathyarchaeota archaeon]MDP6048228.1 ribosome assembly factor SBDS [Candidatus Bathyarchaeota archaeon]MDP6458439.1 ribosome assembly factor SBDS [Candidatus Bathyarchaeota archaeon]MDP7443188.1 ribosome assembly factor SBDS [Candidatus Bathyarchaeota archaeon]|tara:strand:+ start:2329 stop:3018 length:690 start_codon:yes stop_codon:yes gene_type:complete